MKAIEPTERRPRGRNRLLHGLRRALGMPLAVVAAASLIVLLGGASTDGPRVAERLLALSYEDSLAAIGRASTASATLAHLRADESRLRTAAGEAERRRLEEGMARHYQSLMADVDGIVGRTRSVRASQTAAAARNAVTIWHETVRADPDGRVGGTEEIDRLAAVTEAQFAQLTSIAVKDGLAARQRAEAAVSDRIGLLEGIAGSAAALVLLAAWIVLGRNRRVPAWAPSEPAGGEDGPAAAPAAHEGRLAAWLATARDGVIAIDAEHRIAYANAAAAGLAAVPAEALRPGSPAWPALAALSPADAAAGEHDVRLDGGRRLRVSRSPVADGGVLLVVSDGSDHRDRTARAEAAADSLRTALDSMSQGLCLYDASHRLAVTNRRYEEIYGHEPGTLWPGMSTAEVLECSRLAGNHPGRTLDDLLHEAGRVMTAAGQDTHLQELSGDRIVQIKARPTADGGFVATYEDVTERWHAESRITYMARHDGLTDLPNRVLFAERIEGAITQAGRDSGFAVHCLDLDNFKQINDTLGHAVGDELLRAVAHRLMACLRDVDTVARLGGDEFAIVQADIETAEDAAVLARRVIEVVSAPYELADHSVTIGVSIGVALAPRDGMAADQLLKSADVALYRAKGDGRGVFRFFEAEMDARLQARRLLEIDLRAAMALEAFELHYQPIYDLAEDRICGFEALLRWTHPTRGRISPIEFITLAEEIGLIVPLGEWVLRKACAEASLWPGDIKVAVNVSPVQFRSAHLIRSVREALAETGLAAHRLELEITENVLLADGGATMAILHALRCLGARISMDDFGTGYSSLSYLRSFPFDKMKIDQSFIRDLTVENGSGFIVQTVIGLGTRLGMTMTAEGVETEEQLAWLRGEGCDEVQGYLFSPPVPVSRIPALIERWNGMETAANAA